MYINICIDIRVGFPPNTYVVLPTYPFPGCIPLPTNIGAEPHLRLLEIGKYVNVCGVGGTEATSWFPLGPLVIEVVCYCNLNGTIYALRALLYYAVTIGV